MRKENVQKMRKMLVKAVNAHLKNGGHITYGNFYQTSGNATYWCPITCLIGVEDPPNSKSYRESLSEKLGFTLTEENMWEFINGFDGLPDRKTALYKVGAELRAKYLKEAK